MFNKEDIVRVQRQRSHRGRDFEVTNVWFKNGSQYSGKISPEEEQVLKGWERCGNTIEPSPSKRGDDTTVTAFHDHPLFMLPANEESTVWRYMNFDQFVSLLNTNALWFSRGHILKRLEPYEGRLPLPNANMDVQSLANKIFPNITFSSEKLTQFVKNHRSIQEGTAYNTLVNCWNLGAHESHAMWKVYGKSDNCVAIKSTVSKLKTCFGAYSDYDVYIGLIKYIDHSTTEIDEGNYWSTWLHKAKFFEFEQELRCIIMDDGDTALFSNDEPYLPPFHSNHDGVNTLSPGVNVPIDLKKLVPEVYIGPQAESWFKDTVRTTLDRCGLKDVAVTSSSITA